MASKKGKSVVNMSLLAAINSGGVSHISQADGTPLLNHDPVLITVDTRDLDHNGNARVWLTDAGKAVLPNGHDAKSELANSETPLYQVIGGLTFVPSEKKRAGRGGGGAPTIYPWATMELGGSFFVPVSAKHSDPVKSMTSAVSSANMKYSEEIGEEKPKTRAKRGPGNKALLDASGNKVMETVMRRERKAVKKFDLRAVKSGEKIGDWSAPSDGVLIGRVL